ncbi:hypothetical protein HYH03_013607 [Edaphochlamys debaryana]|uniref:Uncharacterized protein n=1 Tax=Edaphochlamys debaryana TaxID=47281 RepID=A0A835XQM5_9CHLO|nr:hypothetical protein HYH03_013607 [Edaphochlamys debaryana]|eukprot:KAG2487762.1 hypothetical protein HYH03_013607 [Edaphochlamys debaryana]
MKELARQPSCSQIIQPLPKLNHRWSALILRNEALTSTLKKARVIAKEDWELIVSSSALAEEDVRLVSRPPPSQSEVKPEPVAEAAVGPVDQQAADSVAIAIRFPRGRLRGVDAALFPGSPAVAQEQSTSAAAQSSNVLHLELETPFFVEPRVYVDTVALYSSASNPKLLILVIEVSDATELVTPMLDGMRFKSAYMFKKQRVTLKGVGSCTLPDPVGAYLSLRDDVIASDGSLVATVPASDWCITRSTTTDKYESDLDGLRDSSPRLLAACEVGSAVFTISAYVTAKELQLHACHKNDSFTSAVKALGLKSRSRALHATHVTLYESLRRPGLLVILVTLAGGAVGREEEKRPVRRQAASQPQSCKSTGQVTKEIEISDDTSPTPTPTSSSDDDDEDDEDYNCNEDVKVATRVKVAARGPVQRKLEAEVAGLKAEVAGLKSQVATLSQKLEPLSKFEALEQRQRAMRGELIELLTKYMS